MALKQVWLGSMRVKRSAPPQGLMRPDLVVEHEVGCDLLGEHGGVGDLTLVVLLIVDRVRCARGPSSFMDVADHLPTLR